ncbi:hypothetical protein [Pseudonocardia adelaidensis]|uniref:Uncharacterized protein n=1 Tax=Pseudonocardia adelaidensis TaxID=648754 RepID=A0ABP9NVS4_9PSEU
MHACRTGHSPLPTSPGVATLPAVDLDMNLVASIVRRAGVRCRVETPDDATTLILAEPRHLNGRMRFTVRATWARGHGRDGGDHVCVGPNDDGGTAVRLVAPDERHLAALVVAQALRVEPEETVTPDEVAALGLA